MNFLRRLFHRPRRYFVAYDYQFTRHWNGGAVMVGAGMGEVVIPKRITNLQDVMFAKALIDQANRNKGLPNFNCRIVNLMEL